MIGRNLSIGDSFTLRFINNTSSSFTFNLFNQGGVGTSNVTPLTNALLNSVNNMNISTLVNGVFSAATTMEVYDSTNTLISTVVMPLGSTLTTYLATINPLTDSFGNTGILYGQQTPNSVLTTRYDWTLTGFAADFFKFGLTTATPTVQVTTYVTTNPFITVQGVVPITYIQQSETGNAYKILGIDIISDNPQQLLEEINYGNKTANGNTWSSGFTPTIDPYQENAVSLHGIFDEDFVLNTDTTFSYNVLASSFSRLTFNYVKASLSFMREFDQALATELMLKFATERMYLDSLKYRTGVLLQ